MEIINQKHDHNYDSLENWKKNINKLSLNWKKVFYINRKELKKTINSIIKDINNLPIENRFFYPDFHNVFKAFEICPLEKLRIVIIGQDPYKNKGQANGLSFSVSDNIKRPPSLKQIIMKIEEAYPTFIDKGKNDLSKWGEQGILLLNSSLTLRPGLSNSHAKYWTSFTDNIIKTISNVCKKRIIFMLWGNFAKRKSSLINQERHLIFCAEHPVAYIYSKGRNSWNCDNFLKLYKIYPNIDWNL